MKLLRFEFAANLAYFLFKNSINSRTAVFCLGQVLPGYIINDLLTLE